MNCFRSFAVVPTVAVLMLGLVSTPSFAQRHAHVYLLRGLANVFSLGMDTLASKIESHGISATVTNHLLWQALAEQAVVAYRAGTEGPIILIGHSLGANAAMEMAAYLDHKGVPVALVVLFDATQSYPAPKNVSTLLNLTQHVHVGRGAGFHGSLLNFDLSSDKSIDHFNIDKSARLHALALNYVLAAVGAKHRAGALNTAVIARPPPML